MNEIRLNPAQVRVLGALVEKEITTPDYYPLSLNALANACNQRSNREPVMDLDEDELRLALRLLEEKKLAGRARSADGRVTKFEHWLGEAFNFTRAETALVCVLLLRGPQTPGELRSRTERLHSFEELTDVQAGLEKLMQRTPPLVALLPRAPGAREARYAHLLSGDLEELLAAAPVAAPPVYGRPAATLVESGSTAALSGGESERIAALEAEVRSLRAEVAALNARIEDIFGDGD